MNIDRSTFSFLFTSFRIRIHIIPSYFCFVWFYHKTKYNVATPNFQLFSGEVRLQAVKYELKHEHLSISNFYNADGIIMDKDSGLGLAFLETLWSFSSNDTIWEIADHIKAIYGLLVILNAIVYKHIHS